MELMLQPLPQSRVEIHTSDRILYRRCRRKWNLASSVRRNLTSAHEGQSTNEHLWLGTGIHFALEDFHGYNSYGDPFKAFQAYYYATRRSLPDNHLELKELASGMLSHYVHWANKFNDTHTVWGKEGEPMCEVNWHVPLEGLSGPDGEPVTYSGTFDRLVMDDHQRVWIVDYKTAQRFNTSKLEMDPQCSAYCWAFRKLFGFDAEGVLYIQLLKERPEPPRILKDGHVSTNKTQNTTYSLYKRTLIEVYGNSIKAIPKKCMELAHYLASQETSEGDKFLRRDLVRRNDSHINNEEWKIYAEAKEMLDKELPLYPNPTRDCMWDCDFRGVCVAMDDGSDWGLILAEGYAPRKEMHPWRSRIPTPEDLNLLLSGQSTKHETIQFE